MLYANAKSRIRRRPLAGVSKVRDSTAASHDRPLASRELSAPYAHRILTAGMSCRLVSQAEKEREEDQPKAEGRASAGMLNCNSKYQC